MKRSTKRIVCTALLALLALAGTASADGEGDRRFYFRVGAGLIAPLSSSDEIVMSDVDDVASLAIEEGPISGSRARIESTVTPIGIIGYVLPWLDGRLSVETLIGPPIKMGISAEGTLATESIAPDAMGIPTGVPALGKDIGETTVIAPMLTAVYRYPVHKRLGVYGGGGLSYVIPTESNLTNPVLTEVTEPDLELHPDLGFALQAGLDANVYKRFYVTLDVKYMLGFNTRAVVKDVYVQTPGLPLYETVRAGDVVVDLPIDPLVVTFATGMNF